MKFRLYFKTPDASQIPLDDLMREQDKEKAEQEFQKLKKVLARFLPDGETIIIEVDTDAGTATVVEQ